MAWSTAETVQQGDKVIFWLKRGVLEPVVISPGKEYNGRFGAFRHSDLIGLPYGCRVQSRNNMGFIHILRPTPELWTLSLPHRTQILYLADIAFITNYLNIRPGSTILEAGTGSASFSHSVLRTIGERGHLYTYEFHQSRADSARTEFEQHGFNSNVTLTHRNVCVDGFDLINKINAVFLDLPAPWLAIPHVKPALRVDATSRICCFSPCIEQVMKTVLALNECGFTSIEMYESLVRPHEISTNLRPIPISQVAQRLHEADIKREERRLRQISNAQRRHNTKRQREDIEIKDASNSDEHTDIQKRRKVSPELALGEHENTVRCDVPPPATESHPVSLLPTPDSSKHVVSRVASEIRGHTSYLTFATYLPRLSASDTLVAKSETIDDCPTGS